MAWTLDPVGSGRSSWHEHVPAHMSTVRAMSAWAALRLNDKAPAHLKMHSQAMTSSRTCKT